jgi:hypothetical protein
VGKYNAQYNGIHQTNAKNLVHHFIGYGKKDIYGQEESPAQRLKQPIFRDFLDLIDHGIKLIQFLPMGIPFIKKAGLHAKLRINTWSFSVPKPVQRGLSLHFSGFAEKR